MRGSAQQGTIAAAYIAGGFVLLGPYFLFSNARTGLVFSAAATLAALAAFGYIKGRFTGTRLLRSAIQSMLIGALAAAAAFAIAKIIA